MLNKPTYAIATMVVVARGKMVAMGDTVFQNLCFKNFLVFFLLGC